MPEERQSEPSGLEDTLPLEPNLRPAEGAPELPRRIGPYLLRHSLGEGGMGEVWLADQIDPIRRQVALKIIKAGMDTKEVVARFESERQALALMDHPAIAKVFDGGTTSEGRPYFVMEYVPGIPITEHCDTRKLSTVERLRLFAEACEGVHHAHQKAIIHRDLKPSNILVSIVDEEAQPKIIDFGIAKATGYRLTEKTLFTEVGAVIGTPEYMSPEQADSTGQDVDTRTDIYSLGVILYQLLTGQLPFASQELRFCSQDEFRRRLREAEPSRPSTRLSTLGGDAERVAKDRNTEPGPLRRQLEGDLDCITLKALEKERSRRYGTAAEFAEDIRRHLRHEPVLARPQGAGYRLQKYVRRHRVGTAVTAGLAILLVAFSATMAMQVRRTAAERDRANRERDSAERASAFLGNMLGAVTPDSLGDALWKHLHQRVAEVHRGEGKSEDEIKAALGSLDQSLRGVNPTQAALDVLDEQVLDRAGKTIERDMQNDRRLAARLEHTLAVTYRNLGLFPQAVRHVQRAVQLRREELGAEGQQTLKSLGLLANLYKRQGRYDEAEKTLQQALTAQRSTLGPDHPDTLDSAQDLAALYAFQGRYPEAEKLLVPILDLRRKTFGVENDGTLDAISELARVYALQGRLEEAKKLILEDLEISTRVHGADDTDTLVSVNNLATVYAEQGHYAEAEKLFRRAFETQKRVVGPEHATTLEAMNNVADICTEQGHYAEAEKLLNEALAIRRRVLGPDHPSTLFSINSLAELYLEEKRYGEAEKYARSALEGRRRVLGRDHQDTLTSLTNLAEANNGKGRYLEADKLAKDAVAGYEHAQLATTYEMGMARRTQGRALLGLKRYPQAEPELVAAETLLRPRPTAHTQAIQSLVSLYEDWEREEPGRGHASEADRWRASLAPPQP
jgi:eukaryotic-like serine/threonine-protein kinase